MFGFNKATMGGDVGSGDATYNQRDELLGVYENLSYLQCRDLFRFWALGRRLVEALPNFALSAGRDVTFGEYTTQELVDRFQKISEDLEIDKKIKYTTMNARIYGMSALFATTKTPSDTDKPLDDILPNDLVFNCLEPLSMRGTVQFDLNPLSPTFQEAINITIDGKKIHNKRIKILNNELPLYLQFNPSSFSFSGQSIFQNMTLLIRTYNRAMVSLQRAATKAGAIVRSTKDVSHASGLSFKAIEKNNEMIRLMENDGVASIANGEELTLFDINNIKEVGNIVEIVNNMFAMAVNDTPASILLDKNLSFGLNDGSEDMKSILMAVEHFRANMLKPLYNFVDDYVLRAAFNPQWLKGYIEKTSDNGKMVFKGINEAYEKLRQNYSFKFKDLYPLTEVEQQEKTKRILENMLILRDLGANRADIESIINKIGMYGIDISLDNIYTEETRGGKEQDPEDIYRIIEEAKKFEND